MIRRELTSRIPETPEQGPEQGVDLSASLRHLWAIVIAPDGDGAPGHYSAARRHASRGGVRARFSTTARTTIDRVARLVPRERLVVALTRRDTGWAEAAASDVRWIIQPAWRGSAAELFLAALAIATEDPDATLALFPSNHRADDEDALLLAVTSATRAIELRPDVPIVLGVRPHRPTRGVWLEPGVEIDGLEAFGIRAVDRVVRDAGVEDARALLDGEALVSTRVVVVRARTLIDLGRVAAPDVLETLEPLESVFGRVEERLLRDAVYEWMPYASAADVLLRAEPLAVLRVNALAFEECPAPLLRAAS